MRILRLVEEAHHRDRDDRPLREGRTPAEFLRSDDIEYKQCQYAGSRWLANPMNVSALRQSSERWDEIVQDLATLRTRYAEIRGAYAPDIMDVWRVSQLGCALPWWFILGGEAAPGAAAGLSKITLGTAILSHRLLHDSLAQQWLPPPFTAQTLLELAESTGTLLGDHEVCAAPAKMLLEFLEVLVSGAPSAPPVFDVDAVMRFGAHYANLKLLLWLHFLARRFLYADLAATRDDLPELAELLDAACEPPDCFIIEPPDLARIDPPRRAMWFTALAAIVVPIAPDGSDAPLVAIAREVATIMGVTREPAATYAALDHNFGRMMQAVEVGLGGTPIEVDAEMRDRLLGVSPRALFARL
jgi:hypothetical protein